MEYINIANIVIIFTIISSVAADSSSVEEIESTDYCAKVGCCSILRGDEVCFAPRFGSRCYCDDFCYLNRTGSEDCCPDFMSVCKGKTRPDSPITLRKNGPSYLNFCPPLGKNAKFELETLHTRSLMYGCAYMGDGSPLTTAPLFHLWLERPEESYYGHGNCDNTQNMDHFVFECLSKYDRLTNRHESEIGWQYISLLEHTAESMQNKTKTRSHRCALYDVRDDDERMVRIIRMVISKPVIGEEFNVSQCNGLSDLLTRDLLPVIPEGYRYWPNGSLYIYLLGRKAKIFYTNTKKAEFPVINRQAIATWSSRP